jgi:transcription elongation factor GreA
MDVWLTREAYDKLAAELEHLKTEGRPAVSAKIGAARAEGDLSENGGYHAAREEQGQMEGRIAQLEAMLRDAVVGEVPATSGEVGVGSRVTVAYGDFAAADGDDAGDTETFLLGAREMLGLDADIDTQVYSPQSPLGVAVLGAHPGDHVSYLAPSGRPIGLRIVKVEPFGA